MNARVRGPYILCSKGDCDRPATDLYIFWALPVYIQAGCYKHSQLGADEEFKVADLRAKAWLFAWNFSGGTWVALLQWLGADGCNALNERKDVRDGR